MLTDRRTSRWLNALCATIAIFSIGLVGLVAFVHHNSERPAPTPSGPRGRLQEVRRAARNAERDDDGDSAERLYKSVLALKPDLGEAKLGLARTYAAYGKRREAWTLYREIVEPSFSSRKPQIVGDDALAWYADLALEFGDARKVQRAVESIFIDPELRKPSNQRLIALRHLRATVAGLPFGAALRHAERAAQLEPSSVGIRLRIVQILLEFGRKVEGEAALAEAKKLLAIGTWNDWRHLSEFYQDQGDYRESEQAMKEALRRTPRDDARSWVSLGNWLIEFASAGLSTKELRHTAKLLCRVSHDNALHKVRPDDPQTLVSLALYCRVTRKNLPLAMVLTKAALRGINPRQAYLYGQIATELEFLGAKSEAKAVLRKAIASSGTNREFFQRSLARLEGRDLPNLNPSVGTLTTTGGRFDYGIQSL